MFKMGVVWYQVEEVTAMINTSFVKTQYFGYVPIRKTHTDGKHYADVELANDGTDEAWFAEIRIDDRTNQPFAVLFDGDWNQIR